MDRSASENGDTNESAGSLSRVSVGLNEQLFEHVRVMAFRERTSLAGYIRSLVEKDAERAGAFAQKGTL